MFAVLTGFEAIVVFTARDAGRAETKLRSDLLS
jgi:hypothetical protein